MATVTGLKAEASLLYLPVATGNEARPSTPGKVLWLGGTTKPVNMADGDLWFKESTASATAPEFVTTSLNTITQSVAFSQPMIVNGTTPMTFTISAGALPAGLTIHSTTGTISGTPSASGTYTFTVQATNANGTTTQAFTGNVSATVVAPNVTTTTLSSLVQGTAFSQTLNATGTGPITWTISGGVLPSGLTLNSSTGAITGSPTGTGAYSFTVQATNSAGSDTQLYTGTIGTTGTAPDITTTTLTSLQAGTSFSQTLARTGSTPMTWGVSAGSIPSGLAINSSTGVISGTPTTAGAYSFTVQATNSFGSDTQAYSGTIAAATTEDIYSIFGATGGAFTSYTDGDVGSWISHQYYQWSGAPALAAGSKIVGARIYIPSDSPHIGQTWNAAYQASASLITTTGVFPYADYDTNGTKKAGSALVAGWNEITFTVEQDPPAAGSSWFIGTQIGTGTRYVVNSTISGDAIRHPGMKNFFLAEAGGRSFYNAIKTSALWYGIDVMVKIPGMSIDIVAENALSGTFTLAQMRPGTDGGDISVAGFSRKISYNVGETAQFCITGAPSEIRIFRAGWYGGTGFRQVDVITDNVATNQPDGAVVSGSYGGTTSTAWTVTASWAIPSNAVSGIYMAMVRNAANTDAFYITFVVRDDDAVADIVYKTSDTTWGAAYNYWGTKTTPAGKNLYGEGSGVGNIMSRTAMVSYHRPVITRLGVIQTYWWACELPLIRFLERNGYSVKYISSIDLDKTGSSILAGKASIFLSSGHDEYWTTSMRNAVEEWRDQSGGHSIFMTGNEVFWRARFDYVGDEARLWCYKDTMPGPTDAGARTAGQPLDPVTWTGTWKDTRWAERKPEWLLTGTDFGMNGVFDYDATIPKNPYGGLKVWGGSSLVDADINLVGVIGFEADHARPTQPAGSYSILAAYTRAAPGGLSDANGQNYNVPGNITWGIVAQRYSSGAVTVGFGTCQWSWTLDSMHDRGTASTSLSAQQFTVNLLNDLGAPPRSLMTGLFVRELTPLDDYGKNPETEEPELPASNDLIQLEDGRAFKAYLLKAGVLIELDPQM